MVILDTNIIIDHLRTQQTGSSFLTKLVEEYIQTELALSMISIQELFEGRSTRNDTKLHQLLSVISPLKILPYNYEVAKFAGMIARDLSHPIEFADAAIAATTILNNSQLATLNLKHFSDIPELSLYKL